MQPDGSKIVSTPGGEGVLANFFNSLLHKKTGGSPGSPIAGAAGVSKPSGPESLPDKAAMRSDAAAELDRLAKGKRSSSGSSGVDFNASDC